MYIYISWLWWVQIECSMLRQVKDPGHHWMNRVCTRLPVFSSIISYGDHQHWRMPRHGNLGQCSLSLCPWALHCGCPELYSVEGSPWISCAARRHVTLKYIQYNIQIYLNKTYRWKFENKKVQGLIFSARSHRQFCSCKKNVILIFKKDIFFIVYIIAKKMIIQCTIRNFIWSSHIHLITLLKTASGGLR